MRHPDPPYPHPLPPIRLEPIYNYLEANEDECQFTAEELMSKIEGDDPPHWKTVVAHLNAKYGDEIFIPPKKPYIVCFKNTGYKIITDSWYTEQRA